VVTGIAPMRKAAGFRISPQARTDWEQFVVPKSIQNVVDAIFELPPENLTAPEHPPERAGWRMVHARVEGTLYLMAGRVNPDDEWLSADIVAPVWPPDLVLQR